MPNASLQLNQLLGDGALLNALKKGGLKGTGILADGLVTPDNGFQSLVAGLATVTQNANIGKILSASAAKGSDKKSIADVMAILPQLQLSPELLAALKTLSPEDLKNLPPEMASLFAPHMTPEGTLDNKVLGILDTLSSVVSNDGKAPELFTIIDDPELADFLAGLISRIAALQNPGVAASDDAVIVPVIPAAAATPTSKPFSSFLPASFANPVAVDAASVNGPGVTTKDLQLLPDRQTVTVTIADLNSDAFQALKKLAFADLAPFLTQPRLMHAAGNTVIKVAQGPSFLNDETTTDASLLSAIAGLVPVLPATAIAQASAGTPDGTLAPATPIFLDASVLAKASAPVTAQSQTQTAPQQQIFNRANLFAALLGLPAETKAQSAAQPVQQAQTPQNATTPAAQTPAVTSATSAAAVPTAPLLAAGTTPAAQIVAAAQQIVTAAQPAATRVGNMNAVLKGLDTSLVKVDGDTNLLQGFDAALQIHADQSLPANASTALISARGAAQAHPATYLVSLVLQRGAESAVVGNDRHFIIQLDPPNLGRVKITLEFGENNTVKAKILAERPETVAMLQKDSALLERALQNSGVDANRSSFSFDLGHGDSFNGQTGGHGGENQGHQGAKDDGTDFATIETVMPIFVDPETGLTHVNVVI